MSEEKEDVRKDIPLLQSGAKRPFEFDIPIIVRAEGSFVPPKTEEEIK